jgi:hypothetical protein
MRIWSLICAVVVVGLAFALGRALATHHGVGPFEYVVGSALLVLLMLGSVRFARRSVGRT